MMRHDAAMVAKPHWPKAVALLGVLSALGGCSRTRGVDPSVTALRPGQDGGGIPLLCARCDDGLYCTGQESCELATLACLPAEPFDCDDDDEGTIDRCNERDDRCDHMRT